MCPACAAAYDVPDGRLLPGQLARCARCETDWVPTAEKRVVPEPEPPPAPEPGPEPVPAPTPEEPAAIAEPELAPIETTPDAAALAVSADDRLAVSSRTRQIGALRIAWGLSIVALMAGAWFAFSARERVMHAWPPSVRAYAALGLK